MTTVCSTNITRFVYFLLYFGLSDADENRKVPNDKNKKRNKNTFSLSKTLFMHFYQSSKSKIQVSLPLWHKMFLV